MIMTVKLTLTALSSASYDKCPCHGATSLLLSSLQLHHVGDAFKPASCLCLANWEGQAPGRRPVDQCARHLGHQDVLDVTASCDSAWI